MFDKTEKDLSDTIQDSLDCPSKAFFEVADRSKSAYLRVPWGMEHMPNLYGRDLFAELGRLAKTANALVDRGYTISFHSARDELVQLHMRLPNLQKRHAGLFVVHSYYGSHQATEVPTMEDALREMIAPNGTYTQLPSTSNGYDALCASFEDPEFERTLLEK